MASRLELHEKLCEILENRNAYFQPPESIRMEYPGIRYNLNNIDIKHADGIPYASDKQYHIIVIDGDPDSEIPDKVAALPKCRFDRYYTANNLNHWVFNLYF